jgi:hypothetical protein
MGAMATPLLPAQLDPNAGTFTLGDRAAEGLDQRLNIRKNNRRWRRLGKQRSKGFAVLGIHVEMISFFDIETSRNLPPNQ